MRYGSLLNRMFAAGRAVTTDANGHKVPLTPEAGMPATEILYSDRHAGTIVEVVRFKSGERKGEIRGVIWQRDKATCTDYHAQTYTYERDTDAPRVLFLRRPDGTYGRGLRGLALGRRDEHYDITR